jgi:hypothetical protein
MAQYDLVFIKNDASSGVSYNEFKLQKPPGAGYSLTQHPTSGVLSWVQSMNNLGTISGDFNTYTDTGYYVIPSSGTISNSPKYLDGILEVFKTPTGTIYQKAFVKPPTNPTNPTTFVRHFRTGSPGTWTDWAAFELVYEVPVRPPEDPRAPISEASEGSITAALSAVENALMDHTFEHVKTVTDIYIDYREWDFYSDDIYQYIIELWGILPSDAVDVIPQIPYIDAVRNAEIYPEVYVGTNYIALQAKTIPADSFYVNVRIIKST